MRLTRMILLSMLLLSSDDQNCALGMRTKDPHSMPAPSYNVTADQNIDKAEKSRNSAATKRKTDVESLQKEQLSKEKKLYLIRPQHMYKTRISALQSNKWMPKRVRYKVLAAAHKADTTQEPEPFELEYEWMLQNVLPTTAIEGREMEMSADSETDTTQEPEPFELEEMTTQEPEPFELESFESSTSSLTEEHYPDGTPTSTIVPSQENSKVYPTISAAPTVYSTEVPESENQVSKRGYDKEKTKAAAKSNLLTGHAITEQAILYSSAGNGETSHIEYSDSKKMRKTTSQIEYSDSKKMRKTQKTKRHNVAHGFITSTKALIEKTWKSETRASTESKTMRTKDVKNARSMTPSTKKFLSRTMSPEERRTPKERTKKTVLFPFETHSKASTERTNETKVHISALINGQAKQRASGTSTASQISTFQSMNDISLLRKPARRKEEIEKRTVSTSIEPAEMTGPRNPETASSMMNTAAGNTKRASQSSTESRLIRSTEVSSSKSQGNIFINIFLLPNLVENRNTSELILPELSTATHVEPTTVVTKETLHGEKEKNKLVTLKDATHDSKDTVNATAQSLAEGTEADKGNHNTETVQATAPSPTRKPEAGKVDLNSKTVKATAQYLTEETDAGKVDLSSKTVQATAPSPTKKPEAGKVDLIFKTVKATAQHLTEGTEAGKVNHSTARTISTIVVTKESLIETAEKRSVVASTKAYAPAETVHKLYDYTEAMSHTVGKALKPTDSMETSQQSEPARSSTTFAIITTIGKEATTIHKEASEEKVIDHKSYTYEPTIVESSSSLATEKLPSLSRYITLSEANEAEPPDSTENNVNAPSTTTGSESTGENAPMEESESTSEVIASGSTRSGTNDTDQTGSNSSAEQALLSGKQQRAEQPSKLNVHYHYDGIISVELLLVTALILVFALFALLLAVFLAVRNERKIQRARAGFIAEAYEVERTTK